MKTLILACLLALTAVSEVAISALPWRLAGAHHCVGVCRRFAAGTGRRQRWRCGRWRLPPSVFRASTPQAAQLIELDSEARSCVVAASSPAAAAAG